MPLSIGTQASLFASNLSRTFQGERASAAAKQDLTELTRDLFNQELGNIANVVNQGGAQNGVV